MGNLIFKELELSEEMQKAIIDMGFEEATPIQSRTIPLILDGKDVIGQAQTGTGKTCAFGIPAIEMVKPDVDNIQVLILSPTRELAIQISEELKSLLKYKRGIRVLPVYGGQPIDRQIIALKKRPQIVIGTPGRIMDHMRRHTLKLSNLKMIILDEADEMLNMGFREQNKVIRDDSHRFLAVQGPAGCGKTSVALHRAAYLLYKHRNSLNAENILIFSPNQVFSDYISSVLPELGEENLNRMTFLSYGQKVLGSSWKLEDMNKLMEYILSGRNQPGYAERIRNIKYKSSKEFVKILKNYVEYLGDSGIRFSDIFHNNKVIISGKKISELYRKDYSYLPVFKRLQKLKQRLYFLLEPIERERIEEVRLTLADSGNFVDRGEIEARSILIVREEFRTAKDKIEAMTEIDLFDIYLRLFKDRKLFSQISNDHIPESFEQISFDTIEKIEGRQINYEDLSPILFLKGALGDITDTSSIKYVIVDEVQDYMPLQFEIIKLLFSQSSLTMLGDLNQSINPYIYAGSFESIVKILGEENSSLITLSKSYRSTKEITAFCRALLLRTEQSEYINRGGEKPHITGFSTKEELYSSIALEIGKLTDKGLRSIAVICKTAWGSLKAYEQIKSNIRTGIKLITAEDTEYSTGTVVIPSYLSKGLEFDAVLVLCTDGENYDYEEERRLFYTVCTRALHELRIYHTGEIPRFIEEVDKDLYL